MELIKKLNKIQKELKAPKNQFNKFGNYNYRSCEDIVNAVKPLLGDDVALLLSDEVVNIGTKNYVKATACLKDDQQSICGVGFAREAEVQKGMADAQITGSSSSYARKYALNGLFAIDDTKDADTQAPQTPKTAPRTTNPLQPTNTPLPPNPAVTGTAEAINKLNNYGGTTCNKCGANMVKNPNTGSMFCEKKCWIKK